MRIARAVGGVHGPNTLFHYFIKNDNDHGRTTVMNEPLTGPAVATVPTPSDATDYAAPVSNTATAFTETFSTITTVDDLRRHVYPLWQEQQRFQSRQTSPNDMSFVVNGVILDEEEEEEEKEENNYVYTDESTITTACKNDDNDYDGDDKKDGTSTTASTNSKEKKNKRRRLNSRMTLEQAGITPQSTVYVVRRSEKPVSLYLRFLDGRTGHIHLPSLCVPCLVLKLMAVQILCDCPNNVLPFVPLAQFQLIHAGRQLNDENRLMDYCIQKESTIHVIIRNASKVVRLEGITNEYRPT